MNLSFMMLVVHVCTLSKRVTKMLYVHLSHLFLLNTRWSKGGLSRNNVLWEIGVLPPDRCIFWQFISLSVSISACVCLSVTKSINTITPLYYINFPFFSLLLNETVYRCIPWFKYKLILLFLYWPGFIIFIGKYQFLYACLFSSQCLNRIKLLSVYLAILINIRLFIYSVLISLSVLTLLNTWIVHVSWS